MGTENDTKFNDATALRPDGDRAVEAPLLSADLYLLLDQITDEESYKNGDRNAITIYKSDAMRIVLIALHAGAEMKAHTAPGEISVQVLKGSIIFKTDLEGLDCKTGQILTLKEGIVHSVRATTEAAFLLTLSLSK